MRHRIVYMAHPVSGDVEDNIKSAKHWLRMLEERFSDVAIVATWITECEVWDDADPQHRREGMARDKAVLERCDELWLVGPRVSDGMREEALHAELKGVAVKRVYTPSSPVQDMDVGRLDDERVTA